MPEQLDVNIATNGTERIVAIAGNLGDRVGGIAASAATRNVFHKRHPWHRRPTGRQQWASAIGATQTFVV